MTGTNNVTSIAGEVIKGIPEKIAWYGEMVIIAENALFAMLERFDIDPAHFMFLAMILLFGVIAAVSKWKLGRWVLLAIVILMGVAWVS